MSVLQTMEAVPRLAPTQKGPFSVAVVLATNLELTD